MLAKILLFRPVRSAIAPITVGNCWMWWMHEPAAREAACGMFEVKERALRASWDRGTLGSGDKIFIWNSRSSLQKQQRFIIARVVQNVDDDDLVLLDPVKDQVIPKRPAAVMDRMDRVEDRIDRVERRLEIVG